MKYKGIQSNYQGYIRNYKRSYTTSSIEENQSRKPKLRRRDADANQTETMNGTSDQRARDVAGDVDERGEREGTVGYRSGRRLRSAYIEQYSALRHKRTSSPGNKASASSGGAPGQQVSGRRRPLALRGRNSRW